MPQALKSLKTVPSDDEEKLVVYYSEGDDPTTRIQVSAFTGKLKTAVDAFVAGIIDEQTLLDQVLQPAERRDQRVRDMVAPKLRRISDHLSCDGWHVYYDNADFASICLDTSLEDHLVRLIESDADDDEWQSWARFAERLYANVHEDIRDQLFRWMRKQNWLTVDETGRLVGYRGCARMTDDEGNSYPASVHEGFAIVDGKVVHGHVPNHVGSVVEHRRDKVEHDPSVGCASGLHVGTYDYAVGWRPTGGYLVRVAVAPEDIVSVPFECDSSKIRCCRFEVLDIIDDVPEDELHDQYAFMFAMGFCPDECDCEGDGSDEDEEDLEVW